MLDVIRAAVVRPDIARLVFGGIVGEEDTEPPDIIELRVGLGVELGVVGASFSDVVARKTPDPKLLRLWWRWASFESSQ